MLGMTMTEASVSFSVGDTWAIVERGIISTPDCGRGLFVLFLTGFSAKSLFITMSVELIDVATSSFVYEKENNLSLFGCLFHVARPPLVVECLPF